MQSDSPLQYVPSLKWQVSKYWPGALNLRGRASIPCNPCQLRSMNWDDWRSGLDCHCHPHNRISVQTPATEENLLTSELAQKSTYKRLFSCPVLLSA